MWPHGMGYVIIIPAAGGGVYILVMGTGLRSNLMLLWDGKFVLTGRSNKSSAVTMAWDTPLCSSTVIDDAVGEKKS